MESTSLTSSDSTPSDSAQPAYLIDARQFYQHDPLFVLLKERWHLSDSSVLLVSSALPLITFSAWGVWLSFAPPSIRHIWTFNNTISVFLHVFLVFPLLFLIYLHLPDWLAHVFNQLHTNQLIGPRRINSSGPKTYHDAVRLLTFWMDKRWWSTGTVVLMILYISYRIPAIEIPFHTTPLWLRCLDLALFAPVIYACILCIMRIVVTFVAINWLLWTFTVRVKPLHPDGSGGLGILTKLMWISIAMLLWDALLLYSGLISQNISVFSSFEISLLGVIYIALVPLVLLGWTLLPHLAMVKARDSYLQPMANELYQLLTQNMHAPNEDTETIHAPNEDTETMKATTDRLNELERRINFVRTTFPTWPVELQALGRLIVALILPPLIAVLLPKLLPY